MVYSRTIIDEIPDPRGMRASVWKCRRDRNTDSPVCRTRRNSKENHRAGPPSSIDFGPPPHVGVPHHKLTASSTENARYGSAQKYTQDDRKRGIRRPQNLLKRPSK